MSLMMNSSLRRLRIPVSILLVTLAAPGWASGPKQGRRTSAPLQKPVPAQADRPTGTAVPDAPVAPATPTSAKVPEYAPGANGRVDPRDATVLIRVASSLRHGRG